MKPFTWWKKFFPEQPAVGATEGSSPPWIRQVAMVTGILAGFAGYLTVRSTELSNDAIYHSSRAVLKQAQASDAWAEYQADSIKYHMVDTLLTVTTTMPSDTRKSLETLRDQFKAKQDSPRSNAQDMESAREAELTGGARRLQEKDLLGYAGMAVQLGIALASVAALTRRRGAFNISIVLGVIGAGITGYAFYFHYHYLAG